MSDFEDYLSGWEDQGYHFYDMDDDDDDYDGGDDLDFDDFDDYDDDFSNYSGSDGSDVSSEESILVQTEYFETTELRFHSLTQSLCGAFEKNSVINLKWYGFDKNAKFIYGVLFAETSVSKFLQIVQFCPVTSGFYVAKRFDGKLYRVLGFDETSGTFFVAKSGTVPTIELYNATSDFEACYRVKNGGAILSTLEEFEALSCVDRQEWILVSYNEKFFQRVIFEEEEKCVSLSERTKFPDDMSHVAQVFIHDKDTVIFVENWNKILVYNLETGQFNVEDFSIDGITEDRPRHYWVRKLNVKGVSDFYISSQRYGVLKMDFAAKKWHCVNFSFSVDVSLGDLSNLVNRGDFVQRFTIGDHNCVLIGEPEKGCFCALFTEISTKPVVDKRNKNGRKRKNKRKTEDNIAQIVCCLPSAWPFSLQDLCLSKLFGEFRKNKGVEKITDVEFCNQIGISPGLIQNYIGSSGV